MSRVFEEYPCGCVSEVASSPKRLPGYCGTHGDDRRGLFDARTGIRIDLPAAPKKAKAGSEVKK